MDKCLRPPFGWECSRDAGHYGPCAATPIPATPLMTATPLATGGYANFTALGSQSKATTTNPKDLVGNTKVSISKFPPIGTVMGAMAMMDGAEKYGPYNWRDKAVVAHIYMDAAMRHLMDWWEGQETADDSKVHHLGHAIACCAILLDAQEHGKLIDDRPTRDPEMMSKLLDRMSQVIKEKHERTAGR